MVEGHLPLPKIKKYFEQLDELELQGEGTGYMLPCLEAKLTIDRNSGPVGMTLKRRVEGSAHPMQEVGRYHD